MQKYFIGALLAIYRKNYFDASYKEFNICCNITIFTENN